MSPTLTLYHGTDARLLRMSREERDGYFKDVDVAQSFLWRVLGHYWTTKVRKELRCPDGSVMGYTTTCLLDSHKATFQAAGKEELYNKFLDALMKVESRKNGSELYQYDCLYVTSSKMKAAGFARDAFAGGERGSLVYWLIKGGEFLHPADWTPNQDELNAFERITSFGEESYREPVIVIIDGVEPAYLLSEIGADASTNVEMVLKDIKNGHEPAGFSFRYLKELDLRLFQIEHVK